MGMRYEDLERHLVRAGAEIERLKAALAARSSLPDREALAAFADRSNWYADGNSVEWTGPDEPWEIARAALEQEVKP